MDRSLEGLCDSDYFSRMMNNRDHWSGISRTIRDKKVQHLAWNSVSATQIENYQKCKRSWFFKSVMRVPEIQRGHQALGSSFHLIMERVPKEMPWPARADTDASSEEWDKADALAKIALPLLPIEPPGKLIKREWKISMPTYPGGPNFIGYTDLGIPPGIGWPAFLVPASEAIIGDYKTLNDFRYMKSPEELANSVQMMSYGKWAIEEWPGGLIGEHDPIPEHVRLLHLYARTKAPFNRQSIRHESAVVTRAQIEAFWLKTLDTVREMEQTATCSNFEDVKADGALNGHCEAYGGCSFRDKCGISKESGIKTLFQISKKPPTSETNPDMSGSSLIAKIQAARAAQGLPATNQPPAASIPPPTETVKPLEVPQTKSVGPIYGLMTKIGQQNKGWPTIGGVLAESYAKERGVTVGHPAGIIPGTGELQATTINTLGELMKLASSVIPTTLSTGIVPPDAPAREQPVITKPGDPVVSDLPIPVEGEEDEEQSDGVPVSTVQTDSTQIAAPGMPLKKRGRPSREEMAAREAAQKAEFNALVEAEVAKRMAASGVSGVVMATDEQTVAKITELTAALDHERKQANEWLSQLHDLKNKPQPSESTPVDQGCTLYVDCYPVKGREEITDFFEWIGPIAKAVAESNGVADYRLINYTAKGLLASAMRQLISAEGLPKAMTISTYAGGADIALEVLTPLAKRVIKKV